MIKISINLIYIYAILLFVYKVGENVFDYSFNTA